MINHGPPLHHLQGHITCVFCISAPETLLEEIVSKCSPPFLHIMVNLLTRESFGNPGMEGDCIVQTPLCNEGQLFLAHWRFSSRLKVFPHRTLGVLLCVNHVSTVDAILHGVITVLVALHLPEKFLDQAFLTR